MQIQIKVNYISDTDLNAYKLRFSKNLKHILNSNDRKLLLLATVNNIFESLFEMKNQDFLYYCL